MVEDFWEYHPQALSDLILEALEKEDRELLRGLQCFSEATEWAGIQGMEKIVNTLFEKSLEKRKEAEEYKNRLVVNGNHYEEIGVYEALERRVNNLMKMEIPFLELKQACQLTKNQFLENLNMLEKNGFIETNRTRYWDSSVMWLPKRYWEWVVEDVFRSGKSADIFISSLSKMIAYASKNKTIKTLQVIVNVLNKHKDGEITLTEFGEAYAEKRLPYGAMANFIERDSKKAEDIRAITSRDENKLFFNREMLRANEMWRERAWELHRKLG